MTLFPCINSHSLIDLTALPIILPNTTMTHLSPHRPRYHSLPLHDAKYILAITQLQDLLQPHFTLRTPRPLHYHILLPVSRFHPTQHIPSNGKNLGRHSNRSPLDNNASSDGGYMDSYPLKGGYSAMAPVHLTSVQSAAKYQKQTNTSSLVEEPNAGMNASLNQ